MRTTLGSSPLADSLPSTLAFRPRYANNLQPWPFGHATRTTFNLQPWPFGHATRTTFNLQPWPFGHATRTTVNKKSNQSPIYR
ncbi:MAG: hypothetical protein F6K53_23050 [Moorea sp. SIO4A1]|uniref:hypothetical protein n=1 Tax=Moorena sp. SIO4A1 TaxID=2607835 RepID=UPI0014502B9E|nr:hypothetical protein [Moorena sp. SIO4A1]NEQ60132.1 hypothetical protein [Moorena sp. SIO4A1]